MRQFVVGDIHGAYDRLMAALEAVGFDFDNDHLYALGDLVDRGPKNMEVLALLDEPWFTSIKGNHELLLEMSWAGEDRYHVHLSNGGLWFENLDQTDKDWAYAQVKDLPLHMTITTASGRKIGLVHGDIQGHDWDEFTANIDKETAPGGLVTSVKAAETALWGRTKNRLAARGSMDLTPIKGVDMVYMGHTPMQRPLQAANMRWIDTGGCFSDGTITVEELL